MQLIKNKKDLEAIYPYDGKPKKYPKKYPCLFRYNLQYGGLSGDYYDLEVIYLPKNVDIDSFIKGVNAKICNLGIE